MTADPDLLEEIYTFVKARNLEKMKHVEKRGYETYERARDHLRLMQSYYADARAHPTSEAIAAAIDVFRKEAMRFSEHRDYDPLWTLQSR